MARSQDSIGWQRFMEGMVCKEIRVIQSSYSSGTGLRCNTVNWGRDLVTRLLEVTHGQWQWLYCNVQMHDRLSGTLAMQRKEELQMEIKCQQELGTESLLEEDCYLADCNLGGPGGPPGYGRLLAIIYSSCTGSRQTRGIEDSSSRS